MPTHSNPADDKTSAAEPTAGQSGALRRLLANTGMLLTGRACNAAMGLATTALAIRVLGMEGFGVLTLIHLVAVVVGQIFSFKLGQAVLTYGAPRLESGNAPGFRSLIAFVLRVELVTTLLAVMVGALSVTWVGPLMAWPDAILPAASAYMAIIIFQTSGRVPSGIMRFFNRFDHIAVCSSLQAAIRLIGTAAIFVMGIADLGLFLLIWFTAALVRGVSLGASAYRELRRRCLLPKRLLRSERRDTDDLRTAGIWRFVWITNLNGTLGLTFAQLGTLLVGSLFGPAQAGLFHVADRIARASAKPVKSMNPAIGPEVAQLLAQASHQRLRRLILRTILISGGIALASLGVIAFAGPYLLYLLAGAEASGAYTVLLLLATGTLIQLLGMPFGPLLQAAGHPERLLVAQITATVVYLGALASLTPTLGLEGAGLATIAAASVRLMVQAGASTSWLRRNRASPKFAP